MNLKDTGGWDNDEIKSLKLHWVSPGTRILLFDSPSAKKNDDWVEIEVQGGMWKEEFVVDQLELRGEDVKKALREGMHVTYHKDNGLNGKVSHIKVIPGVAVNPPLPARIERCVQMTFAFRHKQGAAHEWRSQDSRYRAWFPDYSVRADDSVKISFKMDHNRGGMKDDHAQVIMVFDRTGLLTDASVEISLRDDGVVKKALKDVWDEIPEAARANNAVMIGEASTRIAAELYAASGKLTDDGGRKNFANVADHLMTKMGTALGECIPEPTPPTRTTPVQ